MILLTVLGKLCIKQGLWGKARSYLETGINIKPTAEACLLLARLLEEKMDEKDKAQSLYQQGLDVAINQHPFDDIAASLNTTSTKGQAPSLKIIQ